MSTILDKQQKRARDRRLAIELWVAGIEQPLPPDVLSAIEAEIGTEPVGADFKDKLPWIRKFSAAVRREKYSHPLPPEVVAALEAKVDAEFRRLDEGSVKGGFGLCGKPE
jgi:hypothetical protein